MTVEIVFKSTPVNVRMLLCRSVATLPVLFGEAARLQNEPIAAPDMGAFEEQYRTGLFGEMESLAGQAQALARAQLVLGDFREAPRFVSRIRAVITSDVQAFAKNAFVHPPTFGVGDPASIEEGG